MLEAAREEFSSRGYTNATVEDIATRAGASRATFYMHFPSKVDVLLEIGASFEPEVDDYYRQLDAVLAQGSRSELRRWMANSLDFLDRYGRLMPAWEQALALEPEFKARTRELESRLPDVMTAYLDRWPVERREEARVRIMLLSSQHWGFFSRRPLNEWSPSEREMIIDVLTDIWQGALYPNGALDGSTA